VPYRKDDATGTATASKQRYVQQATNSGDSLRVAESAHHPRMQNGHGYVGDRDACHSEEDAEMEEDEGAALDRMLREHVGLQKEMRARLAHVREMYAVWQRGDAVGCVQVRMHVCIYHMYAGIHTLVCTNSGTCVSE
jgi:hypothetical protein